MRDYFITCLLGILLIPFLLFIAISFLFYLAGHKLKEIYKDLLEIVEFDKETLK